MIDILESGNFHPRTTNDFLVSEVYHRLAPPSSPSDVLLPALSFPSPASSFKRPDFCDQNFAYSSSALRIKSQEPTQAQLKKAKEVEERKKQRALHKIEREKIIQEEKAKILALIKSRDKKKS